MHLVSDGAAQNEARSDTKQWLALLLILLQKSCKRPSVIYIICRISAAKSITKPAMDLRPTLPHPVLRHPSHTRPRPRPAPPSPKSQAPPPPSPSKVYSFLQTQSFSVSALLPDEFNRFQFWMFIEPIFAELHIKMDSIAVKQVEKNHEIVMKLRQTSDNHLRPWE